jgi:hypothetical protein
MNTKTTLDKALAALSEIYDQLLTGAIDGETAQERMKPVDKIIREARLELEQQREA